VNIRLIFATNKDLESMVREGLFREDLLSRINTIHIEMPPLRERGNDIITLAEFFLGRFSKKYNKPVIKINHQALDKLMNYSWPGNIRELQNTIEKAVILCETAVIKPEDLYLRPVKEIKSLDPITTIEEMEERMMLLAVERNNGNFTAAAEQLGITRQTLYNRLKKNKQDDK
jgi:DNA-binding NtrC family response regulator